MADLRAALGHMRETKDDFQSKGMSLLNPEHLSEFFFLPAKYSLIYFGYVFQFVSLLLMLRTSRP